MSSRVERSDADKDFAEKLISARTFLGWSQSYVADRMRESKFSQYHQQTVQKNESNNRAIPVGEAIALAGILGISIQESAGLSYADGYRAGINRARESLAALN